MSGVSPPVVLRAFNNDINTLERAVKERVFYVKRDGQYVPPPQPENGVFAARLFTTLQQLQKVLPSAAPLSRLEFVETFRGRKRKIYEAAYATLLGKSCSVEDSKIKVFTKFEKVDFSSKADPVPRVVSPRSTRYNIEVGRYLRAIEERIFKSLAKLFGHATVFKGMNALRSGRVMREKWDMFVDPVAVGLDARRFDQHVSVDALKWEHSVYLLCFRLAKYKRGLAHLLRQQLYNNCSGYTPDGKLKYKTDGGRMSGDINTSLGNCLLMCCLIHAYALSIGVKIQLANNGDDCVVFMSRRDLTRFMVGLDAWFEQMGFSMSVEDPCFEFEQIEFCQTHPVFVGPLAGDYLMVRHPRKAIAKDTMCIHAYQSNRIYLGWLYAVGVGGLSMTGGVPVFQDFYRSYMQSGLYHVSAVTDQSWGVRQLALGMERGYAPVEPSTRASFYWAFGVTPDEQLVLEDFYSNIRLNSRFVPRVLFQPNMPL